GVLDLLGGDGVFLGHGDGAFGPPITTGTGDVVADFNADGRPDVAAAGVYVLLNDGVWPDLNPPWLRIGDMTVTERDKGTVPAGFTVTLSAPSDPGRTL